MKTKSIPKLKPYVIKPNRKTYDLKYDKSYKIPVNYGIGIKWKSKEGHRFVAVARQWMFNEQGKRRAVLEVTNMLYSIGASHYYSNIRGDSPGVFDIDENKEYAMAGYGPEYDKIQAYIGSLKLECERKLTKLEKDLSGEVIGKVGDWTYRFNTEAEAKERGIATFKERFDEGWILEFQDDDGNTIILAET